MNKRTSFKSFLTIAILISLLAFACSKKRDANKPAVPAESNTPSESKSAIPQAPPSAEKRQTQALQNEPNAKRDSNTPTEEMKTEVAADANKPELTKVKAEKEAPFGFITG